MNLTEFFFANFAGEYRFNTEKERELTTKAIEYIRQTVGNEVPYDLNIRQIGVDIFQTMASQGFISIKTIPYDIFKKYNTMVEDKVFYYHPLLQMKPKMPVFDEETMSVVSTEDNYLEIRRLLTVNQCLSYIYNKTNTNASFMDINRDTGAIQYIYKKYNNIKSDLYGIGFLDFLLFLTDIAANKKQKVSSSLLSLYDNVEEAADKAKFLTETAKAYGYNKELFRDESVYEKYR